jgi:hypothetical protein
MKIKIPKLNPKQKIEKLRRIVLSGPAIEELPPGELQLLETWRAHTHGKITDEEAYEVMKNLVLDPKKSPYIWEPYSDERGEVESLQGWLFQATLFGINGQAWWLVKAHQKSTLDPTEKQLKIIHDAIGLLGCHDTKRDLIREFPDESNRWTMFWSWFHTGPLMEIHFHEKTHQMLTVLEGTPLKDGYVRMERIKRKDHEARFGR